MSEQEQISALEQKVQKLEIVLFSIVKANKLDFMKNIDIIASPGISIGTKTTQKLSLYGVQPVVQGAAIAAPSGGATVDTEARTAINTIRTRLTSFGITA